MLDIQKIFIKQLKLIVNNNKYVRGMDFQNSLLTYGIYILKKGIK